MIFVRNSEFFTKLINFSCRIQFIVKISTKIFLASRPVKFHAPFVSLFVPVNSYILRCFFLFRLPLFIWYRTDSMIFVRNSEFFTKLINFSCRIQFIVKISTKIFLASRPVKFHAPFVSLFVPVNSYILRCFLFRLPLFIWYCTDSMIFVRNFHLFAKLIESLCCIQLIVKISTKLILCSL